MEENFNNNDNLVDIEEELSDKKKSNNYFLIILAVSIIIVWILISFIIYFLGTKNIRDFCEIGEGDKCLTCKNNKCTSCNPKYELINGKCIATFSINATYESSSDNEKIFLINDKYKKKHYKYGNR